MTILSTSNLKKIYNAGENETRALDGVSIEIEDGAFVAIIGSSGSGKSTLLNMLGGLDRPTEGDVIVDGEKIFEMDDEELTIFRRRKVGFVFQNYNLVPILNVYENIVLPIELDGMEVDEPYVKKIIETLGIENKLKSMPNELSGGQQQRVAIARALATKPEIIYFDEPTSALDPELIGEVLTVMKQLAAEGMTMLVVTHEMNFAQNVSNKVVFMNDGYVLETASSKEFFENPREDRVKEFLKNITSQHDA